MRWFCLPFSIPKLRVWSESLWKYLPRLSFPVMSLGSFSVLAHLLSPKEENAASLRCCWRGSSTEWILSRKCPSQSRKGWWITGKADFLTNLPVYFVIWNYNEDISSLVSRANWMGNAMKCNEMKVGDAGSSGLVFARSLFPMAPVWGRGLHAWILWEQGKSISSTLCLRVMQYQRRLMSLLSSLQRLLVISDSKKVLCMERRNWGFIVVPSQVSLLQGLSCSAFCLPKRQHFWFSVL